MWRCAICEVYNRDEDAVCVGCGMHRSECEQPAEPYVPAPNSRDDNGQQVFSHDGPVTDTQPEFIYDESADSGQWAETGSAAEEYVADAPYDRQAMYDGSYAYGGAVVRHRRTWPLIVAVLAVIVMALGAGVIVMENRYGNAREAYDAGDYRQAHQKFIAISWYRDSDEQAVYCQKMVHLQDGDALLAEFDFEGARAEYALAGGDEGRKAIENSWFYQSDRLVAEGDHAAALEALANVADTNTGALEIGRVKLSQAQALLEAGDTDGARAAVADMSETAEGRAVICQAYMQDGLACTDPEAALIMMETALEYADGPEQQVEIQGYAAALQQLIDEKLAAEEAARKQAEEEAAAKAEAEAAEKASREAAEEAQRQAAEEARLAAEKAAAEEAAAAQAEADEAAKAAEAASAEAEREALFDDMCNNAMALADSGDICGAIAAYMEASALGDIGNRIYEHTNKVCAWLAVGGDHYVVVNGGKVNAFGSNFYGQCNTSDADNVIQAAAGYYHTVMLHSNGRVTAVGDNSYGQCNVNDWADIVSVAAGQYHTVGLKRDGTVVAVGWDAYGQRGTRSWNGIVAIAATDTRTVGLRGDGTVIITGDSGGDMGSVYEWRNIVQISGGSGHVAAVSADGRLYAAGAVVENAENVACVSAGDGFTVWIEKDGSVNGCGENSCGQMDIAQTGAVAVSAGGTCVLSVNADGNIAAWGSLYEDIMPGSDAADIMTLQRALAARGDYFGAPNGVYSEELMKAVAAVQSSIGHEADGIADADFQRYIYEGY